MKEEKISVLSSLKEYFEKTSSEQVKKDWEKFDYLDKVGPSITEYFEHIKYENRPATKD